MRLCILLAVVIGTALAAQSYNVGRGAQVRLTKNGLRYGERNFSNMLPTNQSVC